MTAFRGVSLFLFICVVFGFDSYGADVVSTGGNISLFGANIAGCDASECNDGCVDGDLGVYCACYESILDFTDVRKAKGKGERAGICLFSIGMWKRRGGDEIKVHGQWLVTLKSNALVQNASNPNENAILIGFRAYSLSYTASVSHTRRVSRCWGPSP